MTNLIGAFRDNANVPKNESVGVNKTLESVGHQEHFLRNYMTCYLQHFYPPKFINIFIFLLSSFLLG
jgi:hypothetical protein